MPLKYLTNDSQWRFSSIRSSDDIREEGFGLWEEGNEVNESAMWASHWDSMADARKGDGMKLEVLEEC